MIRRRGLSLLEVVLSIAILGVALATIGQLIRIGARNAVMARDLATAQLYCESTLNEVACGAIAPTSGSGTLDDLGDWTYELTVDSTDQENLLAVKVVVTQDAEQYSRPVTFTMTRWMIDPVFVEKAAAKEAEMKELFAAAQEAATATPATASGDSTAAPAGIGGQTVDPNALGGMGGQGGGQQGGRGQKGRGQPGNGNQGDKGGKTRGGKGPGGQGPGGQGPGGQGPGGPMNQGPGSTGNQGPRGPGNNQGNPGPGNQGPGNRGPTSNQGPNNNQGPMNNFNQGPRPAKGG